MKYFFTILIFLSLGNFVLGQEETISLTGKTVNGSTPIYNVSVVDLSTIKGTVTDVYGDFELTVRKGDTIRFSSIGYKTVTYQIPEFIEDDAFRILVNMVADTFLLKEAVVVPWPQNKTMLKQAMLNQKEEKQAISPYAGFREIEGDPVEPEPKLFANPISFIFSKLSKKARQEKKMAKYRKILEEDNFYTAEPEY